MSEASEEGEIERISVAEVKRRFSDVLGEVRYRGRHFIVERNGTAMAALIPVEDLERRAE
jgi:prevent-host-death family protein